jgi:hypothetical protein
MAECCKTGEDASGQHCIEQILHEYKQIQIRLLLVEWKSVRTSNYNNMFDQNTVKFWGYE